ncbi:MAG: hypothetical protein ACRD19_12710 [Terriglobia bacterium]
MTIALFEDAAKRPDLFHWNGAVGEDAVDRWLAERRLAAPGELRIVWAKTGGGEIFESETILGPFADSALGDDVDSVNEHLRAQGLPPEFLVFHAGVGGYTAVNQQDQSLAQIDPKTYRVVSSYPTFDEWYTQVIRAEYSESYGL